MRSLKVAICVLVTAGWLAACAPDEDRRIVGSLEQQLAHQYHECVPLGWIPVAVAGTYYPGDSLTLHEEGVWLPARWIGRVRKRDLRRPEARAIHDLFDELVRVGMLDKDVAPDGVRYRMTTRALPFFYDESNFKNNPDHIPYLCYSTIVPLRVVWKQSVHQERSLDGSRNVDAFRVAFAWSASAVAPWADDAAIRRHSVILGPTENPAVATFTNASGEWAVSLLDMGVPPLPRVVDASVWPRPRL